MNTPKNYDCNIHASVTQKEDTVSEFVFLEYQALRAEKLQRYDYANKLFSQLITFTITVWAAALTLFTVFDEYNHHTINMAEIDMVVPIEVLQVAIFLLPAIFSVIIFHYSLRNSIRICLISDYLRKSIPKICGPATPSWEEMKDYTDETDTEIMTYFDFNRISVKKGFIKDKLPALRELYAIHAGISCISIAVSQILLFIISKRCLPPIPMTGPNPYYVNPYRFGFLMLCSSILLHLVGWIPYYSKKAKEINAYVISVICKMFLSITCILIIWYCSSNSFVHNKTVSVNVFWLISLVILFAVSIVPSFHHELQRADTLIINNKSRIQHYYESKK